MTTVTIYITGGQPMQVKGGMGIGATCVSEYSCQNNNVGGFAIPPPVATASNVFNDRPLSMVANEIEATSSFHMMQMVQKKALIKYGFLPDDVEYLPEQKQQELYKEAIDKLQGDEAKIAEMKADFVDDMMQREEMTASFEYFEGTIREMKLYDVDDPVVDFYRSERDEDLARKPWNSEPDAEFLRKAMKGIGTNEEAIIQILSRRANSQRQEIRQTYKTMYGRDLIEDLKSELSGDFCKVVVSLMYPPNYYDALCIKEAIYGLGTDENCLIEILFGRSNKQLAELRAVYGKVVSPHRQLQDTRLDADIEGDTSGSFRGLLVAAAQANRDRVTRDQCLAGTEAVMANATFTGLFRINPEKMVDVEKLRRDAKRLYSAGEEKKWGTDEETFNMIFSKRSYFELRLIWKYYVMLSQRDIINSIDRETSGNYLRSLHHIVQIVRCRSMYFAERLREAMEGAGTDEKTLTRIVVSRSEVDLKQIKECFLKITHRTLHAYVSDETSGDYRKMLLAIIKEG